MRNSLDFFANGVLTKGAGGGIMKGLDVEFDFHNASFRKGKARDVTRDCSDKALLGEGALFIWRLTEGGASAIIEMHNKWCVLADRERGVPRMGMPFFFLRLTNVLQYGTM